MNCESCGHENLEGARFCANCGITLPSPASAENALVGKVVGGRYRITRVIGEGGMGVVYEAEQRMGSTVRKVAVKTLHPELSRDPSVTARFHRECGTVAQLEHPNTIKVYDFGTMDDGTLYIAMEYLAGKPLDRVILEEGPLPPARVLRVLRQVAGSLAEAHRQGIIHRDLKPENVILIERAGEKDVVKLLDFGIAARTESADAEREAKLTQQGMVLGTPPYMSPEQFTGKALDRRSDIYSMAVMAYEMLTGKLPFDATTPWQWATEHMTAQPRPFETISLAAPIPDGMRTAIMRALSKDPADRFAEAKEFVEAMAASTPDTATDRPKIHSAAAVLATAAMEAAPDFGAKGVPAPTAAMPAQAAAPVIPAAVPVGPVHQARQSSAGGNKGLIIGLGAVAVALIGAIGFVMAGSGNSDSGAELEALSIPSATSDSKPVQIKETDPAAAETADPGTPSAEAESQGTPVGVAPAPSPRPSPKPAAGPSPKPSPGPAPGPAPKPSPAPTPAPAGGSDACDECTRLARAGSPVSAISKHNACSDATKKSRCLEDIKKSGVRAVTVLARKDCAQATQVANSIKAAGAGSPQLDQALSKCQ